MAEDQDHFGYLLKETSDKFEEHSKRISEILNAARENFTKDYTGTTAGVGILCLLGSLGIAFIGKSELAAVASAVCGTLLVVLAVIFRHKSGESQIKYAQTMVSLERERVQVAQRSAVLQHFWLYGLPEGTPLAQIQLLLGDRPSIPSEGSSQVVLTKALPGVLKRVPGQTNSDAKDENSATNADDVPF